MYWCGMHVPKSVHVRVCVCVLVCAPNLFIVRESTGHGQNKEEKKKSKRHRGRVRDGGREGTDGLNQREETIRKMGRSRGWGVCVCVCVCARVYVRVYVGGRVLLKETGLFYPFTYIRATCISSIR